MNRNAVVLRSGPGFRIVHYPLRAGTLFNIVAVFKTSTFSSVATSRTIAPISIAPIAIPIL